MQKLNKPIDFSLVWPSLSRILRLAAIALVFIVGLFLLDVAATTLFHTLNSNQGIVGKLMQQVAQWDKASVMNVTLAGVVGFVGALSFYFGVYLGFIGRETRDKTLLYFLDKPFWQFVGVIFTFCFLGGVVSLVFQSAQPATFAPIQAFVLGATWPSVVTRVMSGDANSLTSAGKLTEASPAQIPTPAGKTASSAEITIG